MFPRFVAVAIALALAACSRTPLPSVKTTSSPGRTATFEWNECPRFSWEAHPTLGERAAIIVDVSLSGVPARMQLDTGLDRSVLYGKEWAREAGLTLHPTEGREYVEPDLEFAGQHLPNHQVFIMDHEADQTVGSIGMGSLLGRVLALHFERRRVCLLDELPQSLENEAVFAKARVDHRRFFPFLQVGEQVFDDLFYDTGSSSTSLFVGRQMWTQLTGLDPDSGAAGKTSASSWGKELPLAVAPTRYPLRIGASSLGRVDVYQRMDRAQPFEEWPMKVSGLIGNAPFLEGWVVVDTSSSGPRLGFAADPARRHLAGDRTL